MIKQSIKLLNKSINALLLLLAAVLEDVSLMLTLVVDGVTCLTFFLLIAHEFAIVFEVYDEGISEEYFVTCHIFLWSYNLVSNFIVCLNLHCFALYVFLPQKFIKRRFCTYYKYKSESPAISTYDNVLKKPYSFRQLSFSHCQKHNEKTTYFIYYLRDLSLAHVR